MPSENCALLSAYLEQEVEVAFGPMGVFEDCDVGTLSRRIDADHVVRVVPLARGNVKPTIPKTPRVTELLGKAIEWRLQLDAGDVRNKAEIARREGITRARVTQVTGLLRLAPEIQGKILSLPQFDRQSWISERKCRPIETITDYRKQFLKFQNLYA